MAPGTLLIPVNISWLKGIILCPDTTLALLLLPSTHLPGKEVLYALGMGWRKIRPGKGQGTG